MEKRKYDSTVARIAGNIASRAFTMAELHTIGQGYSPNRVDVTCVSAGAVILARAIVAETIRTEPTSAGDSDA